MLNACISLCTCIHALAPFPLPLPLLSLIEGIGDLQSKYYYRIQKCTVSYSSLGVFALFLSVELAGRSCGIRKVN